MTTRHQIKALNSTSSIFQSHQRPLNDPRLNFLPHIRTLSPHNSRLVSFSTSSKPRRQHALFRTTSDAVGKLSLQEVSPNSKSWDEKHYRAPGTFSKRLHRIGMPKDTSINSLETSEIREKVSKIVQSKRKQEREKRQIEALRIKEAKILRQRQHRERVRKRAERHHFSAVAIQKTWRGCITRLELWEESERRRDAAARVLQDSFRHFSLRCKAARRRAQLRMERTEHEAAQSITRSWRNFLKRKEAKRVVVVLRRQRAAMLRRLQHQLQQESARSIQAAWRGYRGRKQVARLIKRRDAERIRQWELEKRGGGAGGGGKKGVPGGPGMGSFGGGS